MKMYSAFILLLLIAFINSDCEDEDYTPSKKKIAKIGLLILTKIRVIHIVAM